MGSNDTYRIALCTQGTRGDFQPFIALAMRLIKDGYAVRIFGDVGAAQACDQFNLTGVAVSSEIKDLLSSKKGLKAAISGDLIDIACGSDDEEEGEQDETDWVKVFNDSMNEFKPTIVLYSALISGMVLAYCNEHKVPTLFVSLQPHTQPTDEVCPIAMQRLRNRLDPDTPNLVLWMINVQAASSFYLDTKDMLQAYGQNPEEHMAGVKLPEEEYDEMFNLHETQMVRLCAFSPSFWPAPKDWPTGGFEPGRGGIEVVGRWIIDKDIQDEMSKQGGSFFASGGSQNVTDFIKAGDPPVYIGWGSMVVYSKEHMTLFAVGALRQAGQRGIILGGWAGLSPECLEGAPDEEELRDYCAKNVLFIKSAPHEWLFPQCRAAVHHGGIGTTQASLGAGCPTVITPVFADQHDIAKLIKDRRIGTATGLFAKATVEDLSSAIRACCEDDVIRVNVRKLADNMAKEDGCARTSEIIKRFMHEDVLTGNWAKRHAVLTEALKEKRKKHSKMKKEALFSKWSSELMRKFPSLKENAERQITLMAHLNTLLEKGLLWGVVASSCLVREGESIKSAEVGRLQQWTIIEQLAAGKNGRIRVKRVQGAGPAEGWISPTVKDTEIARKVSALQEIGMLQNLQTAALFENLMPKPKPKTEG